MSDSKNGGQSAKRTYISVTVPLMKGKSGTDRYKNYKGISVLIIPGKVYRKNEADNKK